MWRYLVCRREPAQAFLRIAPMHDLDQLLAHAPAIHLTRRRHVEIDRVSSRKRPTVIFHAIELAGGKDAKNRARRPARPIGRGAAVDLAGKVVRQKRLRRRNVGDRLIVVPGGAIDRSRHRNGARCGWRRRRVEDTAQRGAIPVLLVIGLGMRISGRADLLKIGPRQRPFIRWEMARGAAGA